MALTVYLYHAGVSQGTLSGDSEYNLLADAAPTLTWELEGETLNEVSSGDVTLTCENLTGWWDTLWADLDHTERYPSNWYVKIYKASTLRWDGDVDLKSIRFDRKNKTVSFTVLGRLSRLERYSADVAKRALPTHHDFGYATAASQVLTDSQKNWTADELINHVCHCRIKAVCADADVEAAGGAGSDADTITFSTDHGFNTCEIVTYTCSGAGVITGLADDGTYYAIRMSATELRLATSIANAVAGTKIAIAPPVGGDTHTFTSGTVSTPVRHPLTITDNTANTLTVSGAVPADGYYKIRPYCFKLSVAGTELSCDYTGIISATDQINITTHGIVTGDAVEYYTDLHKYIAGGLEEYRTYWAIYVDANNFKLAETPEDAEAGTAINLTQPASADTHYFMFASDARALRAPATCPTATIALLERGDVLRITPEGDVPYRFYASKPGVVYSRTVYPKYEFDYWDAKVAYVGERQATEPPLVYLSTRQVLLDDAIEAPIGTEDAVVSMTPFYHDETIDELVRKLFLACSLTENEDFIIRIASYFTSRAITYADWTDKTVAEALAELAVIAGALLYSTGTRWYFVSRDIARPGTTAKALTSGMYDSDSEQPAWEHSYDWVSVIDAEDREVRRGRYLNTGAGLEIQTDFSLTYPHLRAIAQRSSDLFLGRRKYREITVNTDAGSATTDPGIFFGTAGAAPTGWTAYKVGGAGDDIWDLDTLKVKATPTSDSWQFLTPDYVGPQRHVDLYCDIMLPALANCKAWLCANIPNTAIDKGWCAELKQAAASGFSIGEFTAAGTLTTRDTDTAANIAADTWYTVRLRVWGTAIKAKYWETGTDEPTTWNCEYTASTIPLTGYEAIAIYEDDATDPVYYFTNFVAVGHGDFEVGYNIGDVITLDSENWWVIGISEPLRAYTYPDQVQLQIVSAVAEDVPHPALKLNGSTSYVDCNDICDPATSAWSVCFWFKADSWTNEDQIIAKSNEGDADGWSIALRATPTAYYRANLRGLTPSTVDSEAVDVGDTLTWHHVALVVDGQTNNTIMIWIDGLSSAAPTPITAGSVTANARDLTIGAWSDLAHYAEGKIRDVQFWDKALSQTEVQTLMTTPPRGDEAYLRWWLPLDEGYSATVRDRTPYAQDGMGFDVAWELPTNDVSTTAARPEPPTIVAVDTTVGSEVVIDINLPTERFFGFVVRIWEPGQTPDSPAVEYFPEVIHYQSGWPISPTGAIVPNRYIITVESAYDGFNIEVAVVSWDGFMSDFSEPQELADYP